LINLGNVPLIKNFNETQHKRKKKQEKKNSENVYLLVEFEPCRITLAVGILESKEPDFAETDCLDNLVKQLFARCRRLDGKFQLGVHRRHPNIDLHSIERKKNKQKKILKDASPNHSFVSVDVERDRRTNC
jgi:hypothetical protein